jgi:sulfatase maturation enzyme AslB (radical SAM superfamily)
MEITTRIGCINRCSYCPQDKLIRAYRNVSDILEMDLDTFKKCVDKIPVDTRIHFSGFSEPWLNPRCTDMVVYAHKTGHKIQVFTTLVGMTANDIEVIKTIPFENFIVHLPDADGKTHIQVDSHYREVMAKAAQCLPNAYFIYYDNIHTELVGLSKTVRTAKWELVSRASNIEIKGQEIKFIPGQIRCTRALCQNVLLPNGDVALCCNDFGLKHILGNLVTSDYDSLFRGEEYKKVIGGLLDDSVDILCRYCEWFARPVAVQKKEGAGLRFQRRIRGLFKKRKDKI